MPSLSQSAWNIQFYFGHQKPCMDNKLVLHPERNLENTHSHVQGVDSSLSCLGKDTLKTVRFNEE